MLTFHLIYTLSSFQQSISIFTMLFTYKITPKPEIHFNTSHSHGHKNNFYYLIQSVKQLRNTRKCTFHNILCTISFLPMYMNNSIDYMCWRYGICIPTAPNWGFFFFASFAFLLFCLCSISMHLHLTRL